MLGEMLARMRRSRGYSLAQLARRVGVSRESIHGYERGRVTPSAHRLARMLEEMGASDEERLAALAASVDTSASDGIPRGRGAPC